MSVNDEQPAGTSRRTHHRGCTLVESHSGACCVCGPGSAVCGRDCPATRLPAEPARAPEAPRTRQVEDYPLAPCPKCGAAVTTAYDFRTERYPYQGKYAVNRWHFECGWNEVPPAEVPAVP